MALLAKKLYMKNSAGTTQTANIYSTTGEVGTNYMCATVDGTNGYVALVDTSDARATSGRVTKSGTTYAICNVATPAYSYKYIGTAGSGTFTVPAGVTKLRVTCVGGGSGGADLWRNKAVPSGVSATATEISVGGGKTTFGSVSANGASNGKVKKFTMQECNGYDEYGSCGSYTSVDYCANVTTPAGTTAGKYTYNKNYVAGAAAVPLKNYKGTQIGTAGNGGGWNSVNDSNYGYLGASGYSKTSTISVTPGSSIAYTVGAGGKCYIFGKYYTTTQSNSGNPSGSADPGGAGAILVEWGKGIQ